MLTADEIQLARAAFAVLRLRYVESGHKPPAEIDVLLAKLEAMEPRISFAEAATRLGIDPSVLRHKAIDGKLEAEKVGRDWSTTWSAIEEALAMGYLHTRRGRPRRSTLLQREKEIRNV